MRCFCSKAGAAEDDPCQRVYAHVAKVRLREKLPREEFAHNRCRRSYGTKEEDARDTLAAHMREHSLQLLHASADSTRGDKSRRGCPSSPLATVTTHQIASSDYFGPYQLVAKTYDESYLFFWRATLLRALVPRSHTYSAR